jgi:protein-disulfide isomerase
MSPAEINEEDLTRKQRREQARAQRRALEEAEAAKAVRRTRLTQLAIVGTIVIVAIVVIAVAAGGGGKGKPPPPGSGGANKAVAEVESTVGGIAQSGNALGNPAAPVTIAYFGDLECPICKDFTFGALPSVVQKWVRTGKVRIEYRSLETATREPETFRLQQIAALAAGKQGKGWSYIELFYHEQGEENTGYVTESYLQGLAHQVPGLDFTKWTSDRNSPELANQVATDGQIANNNGFTGTPSFLIGKTGGAMKKMGEVSLKDPAGFNEAIEQALKA